MEVAINTGRGKAFKRELVAKACDDCRLKEATCKGEADEGKRRWSR